MICSAFSEKRGWLGRPRRWDVSNYCRFLKIVLLQIRGDISRLRESKSRVVARNEILDAQNKSRRKSIVCD